MLTFNLKTTFFTVKTSNEVYCCRIYFVNYIQNVHIINRTLHGSLEDMDFMFSWQEQYLTRSLRSLVRYCSCHSNIKSISSRNRVISYIYQHEWKLEKREIVWKHDARRAECFHQVFTQFRVFPIFTSVDITIYQHGKCFIYFL